MFGIVRIGQQLVTSSQKIKIIYIVPVSRRNRMITFGYQYNIIILCNRYLIQCATIIINLLDHKSLGLIYFIKIGLLQTGLCYMAMLIHLPGIVLMWRK